MTQGVLSPKNKVILNYGLFFQFSPSPGWICEWAQKECLRNLSVRDNGSHGRRRDRYPEPQIQATPFQTSDPSMAVP